MYKTTVIWDDDVHDVNYHDSALLAADYLYKEAICAVRTAGALARGQEPIDPDYVIVDEHRAATIIKAIMEEES